VRPVNLIPPEDRHGEHAPLRSGPLAYMVLGALVALLAGVTVLVLTNNQISESKAEIATLESEDAAAQARAVSLSAYTQFRAMSEQRVATVASLADSRFDWERVMRELALILPSDVWLVSLDASASPDSSSGESGGSGLRAEVAGPALALSGCAEGQEGVAGFVTALKDIDGVTRVGVQSSELGSESTGAGAAGTSGTSGASGDDCRTRPSVAKFEIVVAFDAAPVPAAEATEVAPLPSAAEGAEAGAEAGEEAGAEETEGG
jgi:Tfp pilus assembly protein PilN